MVETNNWLLAIRGKERQGMDQLQGLPMNIWSQKVFKEIGNLCGGYIQTEETFLKNHLHWARIKVQGDSKQIPREVEITCYSFTYTIPVWCEAPVT